MKLYFHGFIMSLNIIVSVGYMIYMIINIGNDTELVYRIRRVFLWIWMLACTMAVVSNIVFGEDILTMGAYIFESACAIVLLIDIMKKKNRWRITLDDIYNIIDIYLSVYGELSVQNEYDVGALVDIIRENRIMDIKKH